ncbi:MAG TPA: 2-oxo-tetronate isomerase [Aestuariivirgaceae bacterium]|jgi:hydroxypyruvate isomerase
MPKLAANISMLFGEFEFLDRFAAARRCGFRGVEILFPYDFDVSEMVTRLISEGLQLVLFNTVPGDLKAGELGLAALPQRKKDFRRGFEKSLSLAQAMSCSKLHFMAGIVQGTDDAERYRQCFIDNLHWAAGLAKSDNITLLLEPLNSRDFPGYLIPNIPTAVSILDDVHLDNVFLQFDAYHTQMSQGRLAETLKSHFPIIRHIQISGVPGRHEPNETQEINYPYLLRLIDELGYDGWVGCEYRPLAGTTHGLAWAKSWGIEDQLAK